MYMEQGYNEKMEKNTVVMEYIRLDIIMIVIYYLLQSFGISYE